MLPIGGEIRGVDLAQILQGEQGKFVVASPKGDLHVVTCAPGHSITSIQVIPDQTPQSVGPVAGQGTWVARKVADVNLGPQSQQPNG